MSQFQTLAKPSKPADTCESPLSAGGHVSVDTHSTPEFVRKPRTPESSILIETIERLTRENNRLAKKNLRLERTIEELNAKHYAKLCSLTEFHEKEQEALTAQVKHLQTQVGFQSLDESVARVVADFKHTFDSHLAALEQCLSAEPFKETEEVSEDEGLNVSAIEEEGEVMKLRTQQRPLDVPLSNYHDTIPLKTLESDLIEEFIPGLEESQLLDQLRRKEQEIATHKEFIKNLKHSLEQILAEHLKSKSENERNLKELQRLRQQLKTQ